MERIESLVEEFSGNVETDGADEVARSSSNTSFSQ